MGLDLSDVSYDGDKMGGYLVNGLGRLVDGEVGGDNFRLDIGYGKGNYNFNTKTKSIIDIFITESCPYLIYRCIQIESLS